MKAFLISGIGGDKRMFEHLRLPSNFTPVFIPWRAPFKNETLSAYALRLFEDQDRSVPYVLIGISFGGIVAVEIAKKFNPVFTVIISSIPLAIQMPRLYQVAGKFRIHEILSPGIFKWMTVAKQQFLIRSKTDKKLIRQITMDGNDQIIKWGLSAALKWNNCELPKNLIHIHGIKDSVFPISGTNPSHSIQGGHMLILENASAINAILGDLLGD